MEIGINLSDLEYEQMLAYGQRAEDVGIDSVWVGETWGWEAFTVLGALARVTETVDLGTSIVPIYSRSPALLGQAAATMATASDNRFSLGIGASGPEVIENWHGFDFEAPIGQAAETTRIVRKVLSGEDVNHEGDTFSLEGFRFRLELDDVDVPVLVGALGRANVRMAGAVADGWMPIFMPRDRIDDLRSEFVDSAESRGRDLDELSVIPNTVVAISEDGEKARQAVRHHIAFYVGAMGEFYYRMLSESAFEAEADAIRDAWREAGPKKAAEKVTDEVLDATTVAGNPEHASDLLDDFEAVGSDQFVGFFPRRASTDLMESTIDHLADSA